MTSAWSPGAAVVTCGDDVVTTPDLPIPAPVTDYIQRYTPSGVTHDKNASYLAPRHKKCQRYDQN
ncbi:hypothetical protein E2C01_063725 [Portunus trituberculatus]|uniref:Uncharacterized protein n=1 Tax=Portunus trituberculatus TaxID=210409 RepID=A0A5B7HIF2_PORTR|nr:hypothetical protein [Portunus trituberculatus]